MSPDFMRGVKTIEVLLLIEMKTCKYFHWKEMNHFNYNVNFWLN